MAITKFSERKYFITKLPVTPAVQYPKPYADLFAIFNSIRALVQYLDETFEEIVGEFVEEAPVDGVIYGRQDGLWVPAGGGGPVAIYDDVKAILVAGSNITITPDDVLETLTIAASGGGGGGGTLPWNAFTAPPTTGWSWINQGAASLSSSATSQGLRGTATNVADSCVRGRIRSLPAASNYTVTACLQISAIETNYYGSTLFLYNTGSTSMVSIENRASGGNWVMNILANSTPNSYGGAIYISTLALGVETCWFRIVDDGTNRIFFYSTNGLDWIQMLSQLRTTYITPDAVGFGVYCDDRSGTGYIPNVRLWSWTETTP